MSDLYRSGSRGTPHSAMSRSSSSNPFRSSQRENLPSFRECFEGFDERRLAHLGETVLMVAQSPQQWRGGKSSSASALSASSSPAPGSPHYRMHSAAGNSGGGTTRRDPLPHHHHPSTSGGSFSPIGGGGGGGGLSLLSPLQPSPRRLGTEAQRSAPLSSSQDPQFGTGGGRAGGGGGGTASTMQHHGGGGTAADFSTTSLPLSEEEDDADGGLGMSGGEPHNERDYHHLGSRAPPQTPPRRIERESDESLLPTPIPRSDGGVGGHHPLLPPLHPTQYNNQFHSSGAGGLSPPPWGPSMYLGEEDGTATGSSSPPSTSPHRHREEEDSAAAAAAGGGGASLPSGKQKKSGTVKTGRSSRGDEETQQQQREEADALGRLLKLFESGSHPPSSASEEEGAPIAQQHHPSTAVVAVQKDDLALLVRQLLRLTATAPPRASLPMHSHPQEGGPQGQRSKPPRTVLDADDDAGCWAPLHETSDPFVSSSSSCVPVRVQVDRLIPSWQSSLPTTTTSAFQVAYRRRDFAYYQPDFDAWSRPPVTRTVLHPLY